MKLLLKLKKTKRSKIISSNLPPDYRHGASFVRASVHKKNKFDLNKIDIIGYALDYHCIYNLYVNGYTFERINTNIIIYEKEGISNPEAVAMGFEIPSFLFSNYYLSKN